MAIKKTYLYSNSQIIAQHDGDYDADIHFYLHDRLGSVRLLINDNPALGKGGINAVYTYEPFGRLFDTESESSIANPYKYTGQYYDSEIRQYYLRARQYDPQMYRFATHDPIKGRFREPMTLHAYLYCGNDPLNRWDPSGQWWKITHREFGEWGWGEDEERGTAPFDYARLDEDKPPFQYKWPPWKYTKLHFRSRKEVYPELLRAASLGDIREFEYLMHQWQDSYVHYDRGYRWWSGGHAWNPSADNPNDPVNRANMAYERCDYTTRELEKIWFKYNIVNYDNPLLSWIDNPRAQLPARNPWFSIWPLSPLIRY